MATELTLGIIKPDGVQKALIGEIVSRIQKAGLRVIGLRLTHLSRQEAEAFYAVHKARPFYGDLVSFMIRGPVAVLAIEGENAIARWRELMGATDLAKAAPGTIRKDFASNIEENTVHGSDSPATAAVEVPFFFRTTELHRQG